MSESDVPVYDNMVNDLFVARSELVAVPPEPKGWWRNLLWRYRNLESSTMSVRDLRPWVTAWWFVKQFYFALRGWLFSPAAYVRKRKAQRFIKCHPEIFDHNVVAEAVAEVKRQRQ